VRRIGPALIETLTLDSPLATRSLAKAMAPHVGPGDLLGLCGGLGAGKSLFARALICSRLAGAGRSEHVPSPSYSLVQTYDLGSAEIWHADLYRMDGLDELAELGLDEAFETAICVVEWADRLGSALPDRHLMLAFSLAPGADETRQVTISPRGPGWEWLPEVIAGFGAHPA
jgi:tRNA threonylcarbamoyladenosine biosynthesis protein TsaE